MNRGGKGMLIQHIRRTVLVREAAAVSDGQLLDRFIEAGDEAAFEALLLRHGAMVLGVCRRILGDQHEAHDAFQATFLVLVQKAASVLPRERVGNFLYGVARQTAVRARSVAARRRQRERQVAVLPEPQARPAEPSDDLRTTLDQELAGLPEKYRVAVLMCDLEGRGHQEAALHLGWPVGTLASRLSRGRRILARRLARRGVALPGGALAAVLSPQAVSASLLSATLKAASLYAAGQAEVVSIELFALTQGVLKAMSTNKVRTVAAVLLMAGMVVLGGGLVCRHTAAAGQPQMQREKPSVRASAAGQKKETKDRLEVRADGKQVRVRMVSGDEDLQAGADRMSYDEGSRRLVLEGDVRVWMRRGQHPEEIQGQRIVIDRKTWTVTVEGVGKMGLAVPRLGPVPVDLDFGFPVIKRDHDNQQVFNFFLGHTR
jgi:RNA polymerase sigma-70 factor (ECF subfamily)